MLNRVYFDKARRPYFVCIGSAKNAIDMIAPVIGTCLEEYGFDVLGTIANPVHALNIVRQLKVLRNIDSSVYQIIAIDHCISDEQFEIRHEPIKPGFGMGKKLPEVGETSIKLNILAGMERGEQKRIVMEEHAKYMQETMILAEMVSNSLLNIYGRRKDR